MLCSTFPEPTTSGVRGTRCRAALVRGLVVVSLTLCVGSGPRAWAQEALFDAWSFNATSEGYQLQVVDPARGLTSDWDFSAYDLIAPQLAGDPSSSLLYALSRPRATPALLLTIDPDQREVLSAVTLQTRVGLTGLAVDPVGGALYTVVLRSGSDPGELATIDPRTGAIRYLGALTFTPALTGARADALAFAPTGVLYAIDTDPLGPHVRLWRIDPSSQVATYVGTTGRRIVIGGDMSFLGGELWLMQAPAGVATRIDPRNGEVLAQAVFPNTVLFGIAQRNCAAPTSPEVTAGDAPADGGGSIVLDWTSYRPPADVDRYEIRRSTQPCALLQSNSPVVGSVAGGAPRRFVDSDEAIEDFTAYYFAIDVITGGAEPYVIDRLFAGPVWSLPNLLINEFAPAGGVPKRGTATLAKPGSGGTPARKVGELVEIRNQSTVDLDVTGFRLSNGAGAPTPDEEELAGVIPAGGLLVHTLAIIDLPDAGGTLSLLPPVGYSTPLDIVAYGSQGGAPTVPAGFTVSRVEGTTASDPDNTSFESSTETFGFSNFVTTPQLGSSLLFNEVVYTSGSGDDYIEIYNPQGGTIALDQFAVSDGVSFLETVHASLQLAPGQMTLLRQGATGSFTNDIQSSLLYLYKITDSGLYQRIDQLGWGGGPSAGPAPADALLRLPDGLAVYLGSQGANWADCGGGTVLLYGVRSPGATNTDARITQLIVDPTGATGTYPTIGAALAAAAAGTRVLVNAGTYNESITLKDGVEVRGASDDPRNVVLTGTPGAPAARATNLGSTAVLAALTIQGSSAPEGAALLIDNSSVLVRNVRFEQNHASLRGGAVTIVSGNPQLDGCLFLGNDSDGDGGAIAVLGGGPRVTRCLFAGNSADQRGGAIFAGGGTTSVGNCVFDENGSLGNGGGALHSAGGFLDIQLSIVSNGVAGAPLRTEGGGGSGTISFRCGDLFNHPVWFDISDGGIDTSLVSLLDPVYCHPSNLDYAYDSQSPLAAMISPCGGIVGLAGPPCATPQAAPIAVTSRPRLLPAVPNPFNPSTQLRFELPLPGRAALLLYDARGRRVRTLVQEAELPAGSFEARWDGRDERGLGVASGVYFARLSVDGQPVGAAQRLALVR